jgi:hypothetical protein
MAEEKAGSGYGIALGLNFQNFGSCISSAIYSMVIKFHFSFTFHVRSLN